MYIIPAIDLLEGQVVRLVQGDMKKYKVYSQDPMEVAKGFVDMGIERLHIVDLDGAKSGDAVNFKVIEKMAAVSNLKIEVGGGIRSHAQLENYISAGVSFAIIGTAAVKDMEFTKEALSKYPRRIILGIDARKGKVATDGWYQDSGIEAIDLVLKYNDYEVESVIYTDIEKDGMLAGLNMTETIKFATNSPFPVIASGGISSAEDIRALYEQKDTRIAGCIVGKAFYEGRVDLAEEIVRMKGYKHG
ncbi:MAG: 1-(5-phosphoribosyl)-5-[(5-phosphoribosylamino)methylideneamino]imidazole-4-carboxamide isomerase [Deferribacteraceae bacterium]|jgi:phosphoribosylformimino-5-aminoimidazole carboxamide ribotide isomerase|nr:1-(5-phosphoribosyl)-5-[(5-phosphoribosylamino)methylideneamino]imidazole-4-carboxamide isomerase [Deferribacteraceae bacterium]